MIVVELELEVVVAGGPSGTVGIVCSGCPGGLGIGCNFDVEFVVCD